MPDFHAVVIARMKELDWSTYRLVKELKGKRADGSEVPQQVVYEFVRGETAIGSKDLGLIFDALGLEVQKRRIK